MTTPLPPELPKPPHRWGRMVAIAGLLGVGVYSFAQWAGYGFRNMLVFTTADTDALRRASPDPTKPKFRFTLQTEVVDSASCPQGIRFCRHDQLRGEKDTIQLPRSITYEFPSLLVTGIEKDRSGIYLSMWHRSLEPTFDGEMPRESLMVLDEQGNPTQERWRDRQTRNLREEAVVDVTLRNFYYSTSLTVRLHGPPPRPQHAPLKIAVMAFSSSIISKAMKLDCEIIQILKIKCAILEVGNLIIKTTAMKYNCLIPAIKLRQIYFAMKDLRIVM